ncbi:MAG: DUF2309 domain-containing protein, partial [Gemmatimonadaceae bacterium]
MNIPAVFPEDARWDVDAVVKAACARIAPAWPLDRMIAVNPWWGFIQHSMEDASARLEALTGTGMTMPREWFRAQWQHGAFTEADVRQVIENAQGSRVRVEDVIDWMESDSTSVMHIALVTDVADRERDLHRQTGWSDFVVNQVSRCCAAHFDEGQATWGPPNRGGLYQLWKDMASNDLAPAILMGRKKFREEVANLPDDPDDLISIALHELLQPGSNPETYCSALLLSVNGWASACAFRRWEAELEDRCDDTIVNLLAIRLAWELVLFRRADRRVALEWERAQGFWAMAAVHREGNPIAWYLQRAIEWAYQRPLSGLLAHAATTPGSVRKQAQVVFCIDVRSEPFRRALEATASDVQTIGFAGFFGAPIAYRSLSGVSRAQLPGLLRPSLVAEDVGDRNAKRTALKRVAPVLHRLKALLTQHAVSTFPFVEMAGVLTLGTLIRRTLAAGAAAPDPVRFGLDDAHQDDLKPRITSHVDGEPISFESRVALATNLLRGMSLTADFAPLVVLLGHASRTTNNPQAAALDCGACGGQSGEVNARVMAALLNEPAVRNGLRLHDIDIPDTTHVVAGVHNTMTDEVSLYEVNHVPPSHARLLADLQEQLRMTGHRVRSGRAASLGIAANTPGDLLAAVQARAADWSEVRPEWGLARNAALIVAPRTRTLNIDLAGRVFLHEYVSARDSEYAVLESIMTAPMVVAHWINMQYYASTVDNRRYGSGDKTLHNVVGANQGVFEGASGDLRTGLSLQSVHDGTHWYHEPLRLSVFIEA